jgi:hypothetical protein
VGVCTIALLCVLFCRSGAATADSSNKNAAADGYGSSKDTVLDSNVFGKIQSVQGAHGISSDPMFAEPGTAGAGGDSVFGYRLRPDSAAIDSRRAIPNSGGREFHGSSVPSCRGVDRGAMESVLCRIFGLIVSDITNPFFPEIVQVFDTIAVQNDYEILLTSTVHDSRRMEVSVRRTIEGE